MGCAGESSFMIKFMLQLLLPGIFALLDISRWSWANRVELTKWAHNRWQRRKKRCQKKKPVEYDEDGDPIEEEVVVIAPYIPVFTVPFETMIIAATIEGF